VLLINKQLVEVVVRLQAALIIIMVVQEHQEFTQAVDHHHRHMVEVVIQV
jgi:hypothetical protein